MATPFLEASTIGKQYDELLKLLLIGDSGVGKTSIVSSYAEPTSVWDPLFISTIGVDYTVRTCKRCDKVVKLQIWDTAGQERFRAIVTSYYRGANGIIMAYDCTDPQSLRNVANVWMQEVERHAAPDAKLILVGNKADLEAQYPERVAVTRAMARDLVEHSNGRIVGHLETSAKSGLNVDRAFTDLVDDLLAYRSAKAATLQQTQSGGRHRLSTSSSVPLGRGGGGGSAAGMCAC